MSSTFNPPGQAYDHLLRVVRGFHPDYSMVVRGKISANVDLTVVTPHSGLCVHIESTALRTQPFSSRGPREPSFEMGCIGANADGFPLFLWGGLYDPSNSNKSTPTGTAATGSSTYGTPIGFSILPPADPASAVLPAVLGAPGLYEMETTEYDTNQTYTCGQYLRAVTLNNNANSGKLTNQNASSGGGAFANTSTLTLGTDTVVGVVSHGTYQNADMKNVLSFFTHFVHGTR